MLRLLRKLTLPYTKKIIPATSIGKMVPFAKNIPMICGDVYVDPEDLIIGDLDGVVVIPRKILPQVVKLLRDKEEAKCYQLSKKKKSILKAIEKLTDTNLEHL